MPVTLNVAQTATIADSFDVGFVSFDFDPTGATFVTVTYFPVVAGARQPVSRQARMTASAFDGLAGGGVRMKALQAIINNEGLTAGMFTVT